MTVVGGLQIGVDALTHLDLLKRVAAYKGLMLHGDSPTDSEPLKRYVLDAAMIKVLAENGFKANARPDCNHEIFTISDEGPQEPAPGFLPSCYWNFKRKEGECSFDLRIALSFSLAIDVEKRGVVLTPQAHGPFVSASDRLPNLRMFKALVEHDVEAPSVAKELAASADGFIVVTWTELGLGGIRRLTNLFNEFAQGNETVLRLEQVFDPIPKSPFQSRDEEVFVLESAQPRVFQQWRTQLNEYRAHLAV